MHCGTLVSYHWQVCRNCATREAIERNTQELRRKNDELDEIHSKEELIAELSSLQTLIAQYEAESSLATEKALIAGRYAALNYDAEANPLTLELDGSISAEVLSCPYISDRMTEAFKSAFYFGFIEEIESRIGSIDDLVKKIATDWGSQGLGIYPESCFSYIVLKGERNITLKTRIFGPFLDIKSSAKKKWAPIIPIIPAFEISFWEHYISALSKVLESNNPEDKEVTKVITQKYHAHLSKNTHEQWHKILVYLCKFAYFLLFPIIGYLFWPKNPLADLFECTLLLLFLPTFYIFSASAVHSFLDSI